MKRGNEPHGFVQIQIEEWILCLEKKSIVTVRRKKDTLLKVKAREKGKTSHRYLEQRPKPSLSTKHEFKTNT